MLKFYIGKPHIHSKTYERGINMTVQYFKGRQEFTFHISDDKTTITLLIKTDDSMETYPYNEENFEIVVKELEWLCQQQPGIFRLLYLDITPWSKMVKIFRSIARKHGVTL